MIPSPLRLRPLFSSIFLRPQSSVHTRHLSRTIPRTAQQQQSTPRPNFYRTHGRAFFKSLTLAFLTYQICYWSWLTIETEETRDKVQAEINSLEGEVRLLESGRRGHRGGG